MYFNVYFGPIQGFGLGLFSHLYWPLWTSHRGWRMEESLNQPKVKNQIKLNWPWSAETGKWNPRHSFSRRASSCIITFVTYSIVNFDFCCGSLLSLELSLSKFIKWTTIVDYLSLLCWRTHLTRTKIRLGGGRYWTVVHWRCVQQYSTHCWHHITSLK